MQFESYCSSSVFTCHGCQRCPSSRGQALHHMQICISIIEERKQTQTQSSLHSVSEGPICKEKHLFLSWKLSSWQLYFIASDSKCSFLFGLAVVIGVFILFLFFFRIHKFCSCFCLLRPNLKKLEGYWVLATVIRCSLFDPILGQML